MKYILTLFFTLFYVLTVQSQQHKFKKGEALFNNLAYAEAAEEYEHQIAKIDKEVSTSVLERIGDCYYFNTDMSSANKWYREVLRREQDNLDAEYLFRYAHTLEGMGKHRDCLLYTSPSPRD